MNCRADICPWTLVSGVRSQPQPLFCSAEQQCVWHHASGADCIHVPARLNPLPTRWIIKPPPAPQGGLGVWEQIAGALVAFTTGSQTCEADSLRCVHGPQGRTWGQYLTARLSSSSRLWLVPWAFSRPAAALQMDFLPGKTLRACS